MSNNEIQQWVKKEAEYNQRARLNNHNVLFGLGGETMPYQNAATMIATLRSIEILKGWGVRK